MWLLTGVEVVTSGVGGSQRIPSAVELTTPDVPTGVVVRSESDPDAGKTADHSCRWVFALPSPSKSFRARTSTSAGGDRPRF